MYVYLNRHAAVADTLVNYCVAISVHHRTFSILPDARCLSLEDYERTLTAALLGTAYRGNLLQLDWMHDAIPIPEQKFSVCRGADFVKIDNNLIERPSKLDGFHLLDCQRSSSRPSARASWNRTCPNRTVWRGPYFVVA